MWPVLKPFAAPARPEHALRRTQSKTATPTAAATWIIRGAAYGGDDPCVPIGIPIPVQRNPRLPPPPPPQVFVAAIYDCYVPYPFAPGIWERDITYEAVTMNSAGQYVPLSGATIAEQLTPIYGPTPISPPGKPGMDFPDSLSTAGKANFSVTQTFTVQWGNYGPQPAQIISISGQISSSNTIVATPGYIDVNGNPNLGSGGNHNCTSKARF